MTRLQVFVPSFTTIENIQIEYDSAVKLVEIGDRYLRNGDKCLDIEYNKAYSLRLNDYSYQIEFVKCGDVNTMFIDTITGSMKAVHSDKTRKESAFITILTSTGELNYSSVAKDQIRGRGNSTWLSQKKPYNIYLANETDLLQMGTNDRWVLLANAFDLTNIKNKIIFDFARSIEGYEGFSPKCEYVDLFLNGEYVGLYLLCEKIDVSLVNDFDLENGILFNLLTIPKAEEDPSLKNYFPINAKYAIEIDYPDSKVETTVSFLQQLISEMQDAFESEDGVCKATNKNIFDYIDIDSFARKVIVEEVFMNQDINSEYFWWNASEEKIFAGPCWDYDGTIGIERGIDWYSVKYFGLVDKRNECDTWYSSLWNYKEFREYTIALYEKEVLPAIQHMIERSILTEFSVIQQSGFADYCLWKDLYLDGERMPYEEVIRTVKLLEDRLDFLESIWINGDEYNTVTFKISDRYYYNFFYYVRHGELVGEDFPEPLSFNYGDSAYWVYSSTGELFNHDEEINENIELDLVEEELGFSQMIKMYVRQNIYLIFSLVMFIFLSILLFVYICIDRRRNNG